MNAYKGQINVLREHSKEFRKNSFTSVVLMNAADSIEKLATNYDAATDIMKHQTEYIEELERERDSANDAATALYGALPKWIPVTEELPSDFVSVQAHMTDAGNFPPVREAYVVNKNWFFPALKEFHPVDMWKRFDKPPKEET